MQLSRFEHGVVIAELEETAATAARRMRDFRVGCVVVVRESRPVGILTDRDLVIRVIAEGLDASDTPISAIVTYEAATVQRDAAIETAVRVMSEHGVRRIPIVTDDGKVTGIVTADDLTVMFTTLLGQLGVGIRDNVDGGESR